MNLAFEDANSKLLDVVSIADVDAEELVNNSLVEILKLSFGRDWYWSGSLVKILKYIFGQTFEDEV